MTSRWMPERLTACAPGSRRVAEAEAEGDVRGGVLVQQRREVRPAGRADARGVVDQRELAQAAGPAVAREVGGEELAIVLGRGLDAHEPAAPELAGDSLDHAARERQRPRAAEDAAGRRRRRAREHLLGGDVRRDAMAAHVVDAAAPASCRRAVPDARSVPGAVQADLAQVERGQARGALGEALGVPPPAVRGIVRAEAGEAAGGRRRARPRRRRRRARDRPAPPRRASARRRRRSARRRGRRRGGRPAGRGDR